MLWAALPFKEGFKSYVSHALGRPRRVGLDQPIDTEGNYANKSHSIFWVTKDAPYVIKPVTTIRTGKWVTVTISII